MAKLERLHETKLPIIIDTEDGAKEVVVDLAELSDNELAQYIFDTPEAIEEIVYRELVEKLALKDDN